MSNRAYALLEIKAVKDDERVIEGTATTPTADRVGDIVEPLGVKFKNPLPLLWQHRSDQPVGTVRFDRPTKDGITFTAKLPKIPDPGPLKDRVDTAWGEVKAGLVRGVSIGFRGLETSIMDDGGIRFIQTEVLELSLVTIPANAQATIQVVKSIDADQRAATGQKLNGDATPPGASGKPETKKAPEGKRKMSKTLAEQITALETKRAANVARMEAIMQKSADEGQSSDETSQEEFATLEAEVETIDKDLARFRKLEKFKAATARPVTKVEDEKSGVDVRDVGTVSVKSEPKLAPGIGFARYARCIAFAHKTRMSPLDIATQLYGENSIVVGAIKANVPAMSTANSSWLVGSETSVFADFATFLRPTTILGKFGQNGIPALRQVPFRTALVTQTSGGSGYWVGEGKAKPLTNFTGTRTTLLPLKVANIAVLTDEVIRDSNPKAETIIRDGLAEALRERMDIDFIDPNNSGSSNVKPASITNGAQSITTGGTDADAVRLDLRSLLQKFVDAKNPPSSGVLIMSMGTALALSTMFNALGQREFPGITMNGGDLFGLPVITSEYAGAMIVMVNASDIWEADDGGVAVDMSTEASLEMSDAPSHNSTTPTGASLVSMFQTNSVAFRAERTINWARRRTSAVAYIATQAWGGDVETV